MCARRCSDYGLEVRGIYDVMVEHGYDKTQNMTFGKLIMMNYVYELNAFCTSIVAQNTNCALMEQFAVVFVQLAALPV